METSDSDRTVYWTTTLVKNAEIVFCGSAVRTAIKLWTGTRTPECKINYLLVARKTCYRVQERLSTKLSFSERTKRLDSDRSGRLLFSRDLPEFHQASSVHTVGIT